MSLMKKYVFISVISEKVCFHLLKLSFIQYNELFWPFSILPYF